MGLMVLLVDGVGNANVLSFASRNSKRVVHSVLRANIFAFADAIDEALLLGHDL